MELIRLGEAVCVALAPEQPGARSGNSEARLLRELRGLAAAAAEQMPASAAEEEELLLFPNNEAGWLATVHASLSPLHAGALPLGAQRQLTCTPCAAHCDPALP